MATSRVACLVYQTVESERETWHYKTYAEIIDSETEDARAKPRQSL